ncbi:MAG: glycosyltransferase family 4 protein [Candidatus Peribacteraceae bacterium]|nr:glycosyltransferase family 4 protein [Candidatus Peribacteraceae bacterium]
MKILLLNDDYPPRGASSVSSVVKNLAEGYARAGHDVAILTSHRREISPSILREGNVTSLPVSYRTALRHYRCLKMPSVSRMLRKEMARIRPDVVHAHNIHQYLTYDALAIARAFTPKVFITMHDVFGFAFARLATRRYLDSQGKDPRLTWMDHIRAVKLQWNPLRNWRIRQVLRTNVRRVIAVSFALKSALETNGVTNVAVIHHGIDAQKWQVSAEDRGHFRALHRLQGEKVILFGGRLSEDKGARELLQALAEVLRTVPEAFLLVIGEEARWRGLLDSSGVETQIREHCRCIGWLNRTDTLHAFAAADLVTTPSLCLDTFNLMNLEAMTLAKPVVGTIFGGTPEIVKDGETGFVCDPRNILAFANHLSLLLKDTALAQRMGQAGKRRVEEYFSLEKQVEAHLALYR